jgi:UDPglucose 6-dehydrogenase
LAFKPNTDEISKPPALYLIETLTKACAIVTAFNPEAMPNVQAQIGDKVVYAKDQYSALEGADALIIATEWSEFRTPEFEQLDAKLKHKVIFAGRNIFELGQMHAMRYHYESIGRY